MSSDEEFSLVVDTMQPSEDSLEAIQDLINNYKTKYDQLVEQQRDLAKMTKDDQDMTQSFREKSLKLSKMLENGQRLHNEQMEEEMTRLNKLKLEEIQLLNEIKELEAAHEEEKIIHENLTQKMGVFRAVPEKKMVFLEETKEDDAPLFDMKSRIVYPMDGGTALITFEAEVVAQRILAKKTHQVNLVEDCYVTVEARPVVLMQPQLVEINSEVCPRRILISNLPKMDTEVLLNVLGLHFHRSKNGGGEVEGCEFLPDTGSVVLTFVEKNFAKGLTDKEYHTVEIQRKQHRVRVMPFLHGEITNFKTSMSACPRTVLLTGIHPVMDPEILKELLEIYFQKISNGGGEIDAVLYNPKGQQASALFENISSAEVN